MCDRGESFKAAVDFWSLQFGETGQVVFPDVAAQLDVHEFPFASHVDQTRAGQFLDVMGQRRGRDSYAALQIATRQLLVPGDPRQYFEPPRIGEDLRDTVEL